MVSDWVISDQNLYNHWREQAYRQRLAAARSPLVEGEVWTVEEAARVQLARQMRDELLGGVPADLPGLYQELLQASLARVNWNELADECLAE